MQNTDISCRSCGGQGTTPQILTSRFRPLSLHAPFAPKRLIFLNRDDTSGQIAHGVNALLNTPCPVFGIGRHIQLILIHAAGQPLYPGQIGHHRAGMAVGDKPEALESFVQDRIDVYKRQEKTCGCEPAAP